MFLTDQLTFDRKGIKRLGDGYVTAFPQIARTGIQVYGGKEMGKPEMERVRVYRPEAEVFKVDSLRTFSGLPVTINHPPEMVIADNWKKYAVGETGEEVLRDGERLRIPVTLKDAAAVKKFDSGHDQLSVGYTCDVKWEPGVTEAGEAYDAVQTNIRANHLAVVPAARGGPELRIGDSDSNNGDAPMKTFVVDGITVSMEDKDAQIVQRHIASLEKTVTDSLADIKKAKEEEEAKKKKYDADTAALQAQIATKDTEIAALTKKVTDSALSPAALDALVAERHTVVTKAKTILGDKLVDKDKTIADIRKQVVDAHLGEVAKSYTDDMHRAAFDAIKVADTSQGFGPVYDAARALSTAPIPFTDAQTEARKAYDERVKADENAWKTKVA